MTNASDDPIITQIEIVNGSSVCDCPEGKLKKTCIHVTELAKEYAVTLTETITDDIKPQVAESEIVPEAPMLPIVTTKKFTIDKFPPSKYIIQERHSGIRLLVKIIKGSIVASSFVQVKGVVTALGECALPQHIINSLSKFPDGIYDCQLYVAGRKIVDIHKIDPEELSLEFIDVLEVTNKPCMRLPYFERRLQLEEVFWISDITTEDSISLCSSIVSNEEYVNSVLAKPGLGVVLKAVNSVYCYGVSNGNTGQSNRWILFVSLK